jgi:molybdenum cofactor cytidylyltransferase
MSYLDSLGIQLGDCVAFVGAGGKTSLVHRLVREIASRGHRALFTTTTKIWKPQEGVFDVIALRENASFEDILSSDWQTACLAASIEGESVERPVERSIMPVVQTKIKGFTPEQVCNLHSALVSRDSSLITLVEADGARGALLKAPAEHEPQIPPCANIVCVVACLDAIGHPLDNRVAFRAERIARLTQTKIGSEITSKLVSDLLCHPEGGLKQIPTTAKRIGILTYQGERKDNHLTKKEMRKHGFEIVEAISLGDDRITH